jgi:drug/metabolite transporter (DMT)-like permease
MHTSQRTGLVLGVLAALLWSPHFFIVDGLRREGVPLLPLQFHLLFWPALALGLLLFLGGRSSALSVFQRRETYFLVLAAAGGYGFWILRGLALESADPSRAHLLFYAAPLLIALFSRSTQQQAALRVGVGLLLGFVGCALIGHSLSPGAAESLPAGRGGVLALAGAACWALFAVMARPVVRQEAVLPVAVLGMGIGAAALFVTCLSTGESVFDVSIAQVKTLFFAGVVTVGLMMAAWLKCLAGLPAARAAPFWYLGMLFGVIWAGGAGWRVAGWWTLAGAVLILLGAQNALSGRRQVGVTMSDIIRGQAG